MPTPTNSTPPAAGVPSGNGKYIAIAVLLLGAVAGISIWQLTKKPPEPTTLIIDGGAADAAPITTFTAGRNPEDDIGLPPPIVDAGDKPKETTSSGGTSTGSYQCDVKKCGGVTTPELEAVLSNRSRQAHRCYDNALAQDPTLKGKITIGVRVGTNGTVCPNVSVVSNDMGSSTVAQCVLGYYRGVNLPAPKNGCADVQIPINFVPRQ